MSCRFVAFLAIAVLVVLDLLTTSAVPTQIQTHKHADNNDNLPHLTNPSFTQLTSKSKKDNLFVKDFDYKTVNGANVDSVDSFYYWESPENTQIRILWSKFEIEDSQENYVSAYAGVLSTPGDQKRNFDKTKSTMSGFKDQVKALPFLFSSKNAIVSNLQPNILLNTMYTSDTNKLTLHFTHPTRAEIHDGLQAVIDYVDKPIEEIDPSHKVRKSLDEIEEPSTSANISFPICCDFGETQTHEHCQNLDKNIPREFTSSGGTISSHPAYSQDHLRAQRNCRVKLTGAGGGDIKFSIKNLDIADKTMNHLCKEENAYFRITDLQNGQKVTLCNEEKEADYIFGNEVELEIYSGEWNELTGFALIYKVLANAKPKSNNKKVKMTKTSRINEDELTSESPSKTEENNEESKTNEPGIYNGQKKDSKFLLLITIIVGVILIIILICAGLIACCRLRESDRAIAKLNQKLDDFKNIDPMVGWVDGSGNSLNRSQYIYNSDFQRTDSPLLSTKNGLSPDNYRIIDSKSMIPAMMGVQSGLIMKDLGTSSSQSSSEELGNTTLSKSKATVLFSTGQNQVLISKNDFEDNIEQSGESGIEQCSEVDKLNCAGKKDAKMIENIQKI